MSSHIFSSDGDVVVIEDGFFSWSHDGSPCLQRINMKLKIGALVAVVGNVGSGKSSLLSAMLGEMERRRGYVSIKVIIKMFIITCYLIDVWICFNHILGEIKLLIMYSNSFCLLMLLIIETEQFPVIDQPAPWSMT